MKHLAAEEMAKLEGYPVKALVTRAHVRHQKFVTKFFRPTQNFFLSIPEGRAFGCY